MAHLKKDPVTGHLLKHPISGHLIKGCPCVCACQVPEWNVDDWQCATLLQTYSVSWDGEYLADECDAGSDFWSSPQNAPATTSPCYWRAEDGESPYSVIWIILTDSDVRLDPCSLNKCYWYVYMYNGNQPGYAIWIGYKLGGSTPVGAYTECFACDTMADPIRNVVVS